MTDSRDLMNNILIWTPRVLTIAFAIFLSLFALDVFGEGHGFWRTAGELLLHLVPSLLVLGVLCVAWRREWFGALLFAVFAALYLVMAWGRFPPSVYFTISGPLALIGILFLVNWIVRTKHATRAGV